MQIGFTSWVFRTTSMEEVFAWAAEHGLSGLQLDRWSKNPKQVKELMARFPQVKVHGLGCCDNYLEGDAAKRQQRADGLKRGIEAAAELGVPVAVIFAGRDPFKTTEDNLPLFQETFTPLVAMAEKYGVRLAMENCAQRNWWPTGGNLASTTENLRKLFELVPSQFLGLTFDPSHYVWQGMDYIKAVQEFGPRIYFAHAKDTEVKKNVLADTSIYGDGWWRYRLPGWGQVDWPAFFTALREVGYSGPVAIEHEDALWSHNDDEVKHGLLLAQGFLKRFG